MNASERTSQRIRELIAFGEGILKAKKPRGDGGSPQVDGALSQQWGASAADMLSRTFGRDSEYYQRFKKVFQAPGYYTDLDHGLAIVRAAGEDLSREYLFETTALIRAEVFSDVLEQAEYLFQQDFYQAAAVLAGAVLEDSLRNLCHRNGII